MGGMMFAEVNAMTVTELTQGVQFTVDQSGQVTAVVLDPALWQRIVEALEDVEDRDLVARLQARLAAGPIKSGALRSEDVADSSYRAASERQIALMTDGLDFGSEGNAALSRDELHNR
jgi:hypothetical protein